MIDFEVPESIKEHVQAATELALRYMRPYSRYYDERETEQPWEYINAVWETEKKRTADILDRARRLESQDAGVADAAPKPASLLQRVHVGETFSWGDAAISHAGPGGQLGGAAVDAVGTLEQKERFLRRYAEGEPKWAAMALTEPGAGSDSAAIQTTARREGNEWVLNGEKIFCTHGLLAGVETPGIVVVWATVDKSAGRAGIKPFVVEAGTPGMTVAKLEHKMGYRVSDTAAVVFEECRIPLDNVLGSPEVHDPAKTKGFQGAMATFDSTRPAVAAGAHGIGRAAFEVARDELAKVGVSVPYGTPRHQLTAVQRDLLEMEMQLKAAWMLVLRAAWLADTKRPNSLEASMAKAKAGQVVTKVTQKAVELLGPLGYSRQLLVEKWMRDGKVCDIFEGTGQINMLIVARRILDFTRHQLK